VGNDPSAILIALGVLLVLTLVMRWVFAPPRTRHVVRPVDAAESSDLGLLTVVVSGVERRDALRQKALLDEAGIRCSLSRRRDGRLDVLVFAGDADAARLWLGV
jgi:hypothetical protein